MQTRKDGPPATGVIIAFLLLPHRADAWRPVVQLMVQCAEIRNFAERHQYILEVRT